MATENATVTKPRVFLLTGGRTGSHLLERILSTQPDTELLFHPFHAALRGAGAPYVREIAEGTVSKEATEETHARYQQCFETMLARLAELDSQGKRIFLHEHPVFMLDPALLNQAAAEIASVRNEGFPGPYSAELTVKYPGETEPRSRTNPTAVPDDFWINANAYYIMPIRHPALVLPSVYRTLNNLHGLTMHDTALRFYLTTRDMRNMYDWLKEQGKEPIVIDADDVMVRDSPVMHKLCQLVEFDPAHLNYEWDVTTKETLEKMHPAAPKVFGTLFSSKGLRSDKSARDLDIQTEKEKWRADWGVKVAEYLLENVEREMSHYEYMSARKLKV